MLVGKLDVLMDVMLGETMADEMVVMMAFEMVVMRAMTRFATKEY